MYYNIVSYLYYMLNKVDSIVITVGYYTSLKSMKLLFSIKLYI